MPAIGGSIESISIKGRLFPVASDADVQRKLGGKESEVQANGDGSARIVLTHVPWSLSGVQVEVDDARQDQEFLQGIANSKEFAAVTITLASGLTYQGVGTVTGEVQFSTNNSTAQIDLMGQKTMTQQ